MLTIPWVSNVVTSQPQPHLRGAGAHEAAGGRLDAGGGGSRRQADRWAAVPELHPQCPLPASTAPAQLLLSRHRGAPQRGDIRGDNLMWQFVRRFTGLW